MVETLVLGNEPDRGNSHGGTEPSVAVAVAKNGPGWASLVEENKKNGQSLLVVPTSVNYTLGESDNHLFLGMLWSSLVRENMASRK